jgi:hypothetical protein
LSVNRIVFIGNCDKTNFWTAIASKLVLVGYSVDWILVNRSQVESVKKSLPESNVLYLPLSRPLSEKTFDIKINDLVYRDRRLMLMRKDGLAYLKNIQTPIHQFLVDGEPALVVGELTYGYEILTHRIVKSIEHFHWASPFLTRKPSGKFSFFCDESFSREIDIPYDSLPPSQFSVNPDFDYVESNKNIVKHMNSGQYIVNKIKSFLLMRRYDKDDVTYRGNTRIAKLRKNVRWSVNKLSYLFVKRKFLSEMSSDKRYIVFPLHLEPELNIDTCGRYWEDQRDTILKIWRQLLPDDVLLIKEHPVAIGNRGFFWFQNLSKFPNIEVLHEKQNIERLLDRVEYVFTISGTMGLEAAMKGKKVLCFGPNVYDRLENVTKVSIQDLLESKNIDDLYHHKGMMTESLKADEFERLIERKSFKGDPEGDAQANPNVFGEVNIRLVSNAFDSVCSLLN